MSLTVCVPAMKSRFSLLSRLLWHLTGQNVEVLISMSDRPMGDKLNEMFAAATSTHVVAVDDDDVLDPLCSYYIGELYQYDFIGYRILYTEGGKFGGSVAHRGDGNTSWVGFDRGVSPKCPVRTDIARAHQFGNHYAADREWSEAVQSDIATHAFVDRHLYHYDHWEAHMLGTTPDAGRLSTPQRDVGYWPFKPGDFSWLA